MDRTEHSDDFGQQFVAFQDELKAYLHRLVATRADAEDLAHDTYERARRAYGSFEGRSSLKTWVFRIATNLAQNHARARRRWSTEVTAHAKDRVMAEPELAADILHTREHAEYGAYEVREHISTCFTCMGKTLPIEQQVAVILKDIYRFGVGEIALIIGETDGVVKYLLQRGRRQLAEIFAQKCALVNKTGACHQCSELNGWLNPDQRAAERRAAEQQLRPSGRYDREELLALRAKLVAAIDPLRSDGHELQEVLMRCNVLVSEG